MRFVVWVGLLIGMVVGHGSSSSAQLRQRFLLPPVESQLTPAIDRRIQTSIDDARELIRHKQYGPAVTRLQSVLDHPEDYFLEKDFRTKRQSELSIRAQAMQILADLPAEGRTAYEFQVGTLAQDLLKEAIARNDLEKVAQIASQYQMTAAGFEAMQFLAGHAFDLDHPLEAALLYESLTHHPRADGPLKGPLLLQAAYAWQLAGQSERSLSVLETLRAANVPVPWRIAGRGVEPIQDVAVAPAWLQKHFGPPLKSETNVVSTWSLPRGGSTGNESATPACPVGGGSWSVTPRTYLRLVTDPEANRQRIEAFDELTQDVERALRDNNRLTQPAAVPIIVGDVVVYRTLNDVTAISLRTGRLLWRSSTTDGMLAWLFQSPFASSENVPSLSLLTFRGYLRFKLFRDQLSGSLSSDGKNVYAIEESESQFGPLLSRNRLMLEPANKLVAYELSGGRLIWEVGGPNGTPPAELSGFFFLGPPLPSGGRLYCLAESKNEMRLVSLIPENSSVRLEWSQPLITNGRNSFLAPRRFAGLVPALSEGIAVCPTAQGGVVAFDLNQRQLRWGYTYDSFTRRNPQGGNEFFVDEEEGRWLDEGPVIANGRVLITPRDSNELHCLNLLDGTLLWKRPREQGLYLAGVHDDRVIVIGRTHVVAYSFIDGTDLWKEPTEIPEPAGRGVRIQSQYLLPLSTGEIATLDLASGRILGRSKLPQGQIPGNLAVGAGALVSCGTNDIVGFRSLTDVEQQVSRQLTTNPVDAEALALRGELRLHRGQENEAITDLRQSLQQRPNASVKRVLAETLLNRVRNDSRTILQFAGELDSLTDDPRQRIDFIRLYATALSDSGNPAQAAARLIRLVLNTEIPDEMISVGPGHLVSKAQSIRSQLFSIYESADPDQKQAIRTAFTQEFEAAEIASDRLTQLSRFVKLAEGHPGADRALLRIADSKDKFRDERPRTTLLERLTQSENPTIAATAVATLASRFLAANARDDAQQWMKLLRSRHSQDICRDGKTGREVSDEWLARGDARMNRPGSSWPEGLIDVERTEQSTTQATFPVDVVTRVGHYFDGWTFETDSLVTMLTARDPSLKVVWRLPLLDASDQTRGQPSQIHICGRRIAFSSGMWLGVMESTNSSVPPKILFDRSLRPMTLTATMGANVPVERRLLPNGRRFQLMSDVRGTAGFLIGLSDEAVCYQLDNRLYAVDPATGRLLWSRTGQQFAKADGTVDQSVVLNTSTNGAMVLRTRDGALRDRYQGNPHDAPLWFRGSRRLSQRNVGTDQRLFEMRDFDGDHVVWQSQHPAGSIPCNIENDELAILEPNGKLSILKLETGKVQLSVELPAKRPQKGNGHLAIQKLVDRYVIVAGVAARNTEKRQITPLNIGSPKEFGFGGFSPPSIAAFTIDGFVCSVHPTDGTLQWSVPVADLAFDTAQPSSLPVLVLASLQSEIDRFTGVSQPPQLSALVLDKRTGRRIYETQELMTPIGRGVQFNPMIDERKLVIDFYNWQLELSFPPPK